MLLAKVVTKEHFYLELCYMKGGYRLQIHSFVSEKRQVIFSAVLLGKF